MIFRGRHTSLPFKTTSKYSGEMKYLLFILIAVLFSGCVTQNKCLFKFPPPPADTVFSHSVEWKDTTIYKYLPGKTIRDSVIVEKLIERRVNVPYTSLYAETDFSEATASIENNKLKLELIQRDSLLAIYLDSAVRNSTDTNIIEQPYIKEIPVKTRYQDFVGYGFWIVLGLFIFTIAFLILRK